jgi:hypothetical protein
MKKTISIITLLFIILIAGLVNDIMNMYPITNYIDAPFLIFIFLILTLTYAFAIFLTVLSYKYQ